VTSPSQQTAIVVTLTKRYARLWCMLAYGQILING